MRGALKWLRLGAMSEEPATKRRKEEEGEEVEKEGAGSDGEAPEMLVRKYGKGRGVPIISPLSPSRSAKT